MSNYDEVKFLRRKLKEAKTELHLVQAQLNGARQRYKDLEVIVKAQQETIREANDARRVSQHYAMKYLGLANKTRELER